MRRIDAIGWAAALIGAAALAGQAMAAPAPVTTTGGAVQGVQAGEVVSYKGIPYAAPPVGPLRWRMPQPPAPWQGVKVADSFGSSCMQTLVPGAPGGDLPVSEDCLYLNLWTAAKTPAARLPVMVWIHGGGFQIGSGSWAQTDGTSFARRGVVLVSLNYRMGKLGFFANPALTREAADPELGNYGLADMVSALKWVRANIAAFGGDPDNVTIFGESAGGMAVNFLMESPGARGLFHKAIVESGGGRGAFDSFQKAEAAGAASAAAWGVTSDDAAALRALSIKTVMTGSMMMSGGASPMIDGKIVPEPVLDAFRAGRVAHVPYVIGSNKYEAGLFPDMIPAITKSAAAIWPKVETTYDGYGSHDPKMVAGEFTTDAFMGEPARAVARAAAAHGLPTYLYQFSYLRPSQRDGKIPGPLHFDEVYVVFDSMGTAPPPPSSDPKAVDAMESRWVSFARTGAPGGGWPALKAGDERVEDFTNDGPVVRKDFRKAQYDLVESWADAPK